MLSAFRLLAVVAALFSFCLASVAHSQEHKQNESEQSAKTTDNSKDPSRPQPIVLEIKPPSRIQVETTTNKQEADEKSQNDWWMVRSTIWLAGFTTLLAFFTAGLWIATYRLARDAKESAATQVGKMDTSLGIARDAANASKESADAARDTVAMMETTAKRELRAYVAIEQISFVVRRLEGGGGIIGMYDPSVTTDDLRICPKNYGQTPGLDLSIYCRASSFRPTDRTLEHQLFGKQMFHPGMTQSYHIASPPHRQPFQVWGHIVYRDIYKRWWRTNFWYSHEARNDFDQNAPQNVFAPQDEYNEEKGPYQTESDALQDINEAP